MLEHHSLFNSPFAPDYNDRNRQNMRFGGRLARWARKHAHDMHFGGPRRSEQDEHGVPCFDPSNNARDDGNTWSAMSGRHHGGPEGGHAGPFGFGHGGFPFGPPPWDRFPKGPRARRGDIRSAILALLAEQPRNGYQIMQELEQRSQGMWRPSPGSVYPALQQLEDEGLVSVETSGTGKTFRLTEQGQAYVKEHPEAVASPWEVAGARPGEQMIELSRQIAQVASAVALVARTGSTSQMAEAKKILNEVRRALYRLLAEDDTETDSEDAATGDNQR
jgi:DNA-binding PadR family transcriptional regulator